MRIKAMASRILTQLIHDKRTMALILAAPLLLLSLIYFLLNGTSYVPQIAAINVPQSYMDALYENDANAKRYSPQEAEEKLRSGDVIAIVSLVDGKLHIQIDGSHGDKAEQTLQLLEQCKISAMSSNPLRPDLISDVDYIYGAEDLEMFDNFGSAMIGILIFFFVFLISGISFLQERTTGTLERLLSTPIRRWEIVAGYVLGFGAVAAVQASLVSLYAIGVLNVMMSGSILLVLLFSILSALTALTLGLLASTVANNEFQVIQFIPLVIIPQIFFSGLFSLTGIWEYVGYFMPLYYVADALQKIMIQGAGFSDVKLNFIVLFGLCALFMILNTLLLKKHRTI